MASPTVPTATPTFHALNEFCLKSCQETALLLRDARRQRKAKISEEFKEYSKEEVVHSQKHKLSGSLEVYPSDMVVIKMPVPSLDNELSDDKKSDIQRDSALKSASDQNGGSDTSQPLSAAVYTASTDSSSNNAKVDVQSGKRRKLKTTSSETTICCCTD